MKTRAIIAIPSYSMQTDIRMLITIAQFAELVAIPILASSSELKELRDLLSLRLCEAAAQAKATHVLWADDDMYWNPADARELMRRTNGDIDGMPSRRAVAALACDRYGHLTPVGTLLPEQEIGRWPRYSNIGFGLVAIRAESWLSFCSEQEEYVNRNGVRVPRVCSGMDAPDDLAFGIRWRKWGGTLETDLNTRISHFGRHPHRIPSDWDFEKVLSATRVDTDGG